MNASGALQKDLRSLFRLLAWLSRPLKQTLIGGIFAISAQAVLLVAAARTLGFLVEEGLSKHLLPETLHWLAFTVGIQGLSAASGFYGRFLLARASVAVVQETRAVLFSRILALPFSVLDCKQSGDLLSVLTSEIENLDQLFRDSLVRLAQTSVHLFVLLVTAWVVHRGLTVILALGALPALFVAISLRKPVRSAQRKVSTCEGTLGASLVETVSGWPTLQGVAAEEWGRAQMERALSVSAEARLSSNRWEAFSGACLPSFCYFPLLGIGLAVLLGSHWAIPLGIGVMFLRLGQQLVFPVQALAAECQSLQGVFQSLERIVGLAESKVAAKAGAQQAVAATLRRLELDRVQLSYGDRTSLAGVTFHVEAGEAVGLNGPSGSGKSSVVAAILGAYEVQHGAISWNGVSVSALTRQSMREQIAYAGPEPFLVTGTWRDNLTLGEHRSDSIVLKVSSLLGLQLGAAALDMPLDLSTITLGDKQLIQLARVLIKTSSLIILDEATSALEPGRERAMLRNLLTFAGDRALLVVSHRPSALEICGRVVSLDHGEVIRESRRDRMTLSQESCETLPR